MNNLVVQKNWIPLAHCVQRKWLSKVYVKLSRKDTTNLQEHFFERLNVVTETIFDAYLPYPFLRGQPLNTILNGFSANGFWIPFQQDPGFQCLVFPQCSQPRMLKEAPRADDRMESSPIFRLDGLLLFLQLHFEGQMPKKLKKYLYLMPIHNLSSCLFV